MNPEQVYINVLEAVKLGLGLDDAKPLTVPSHWPTIRERWNVTNGALLIGLHPDGNVMLGFIPRGAEPKAKARVSFCTDKWRRMVGVTGVDYVDKLPGGKSVDGWHLLRGNSLTHFVQGFLYTVRQGTALQHKPFAELFCPERDANALAALQAVGLGALPSKQNKRDASPVRQNRVASVCN
jgi:hypothetical protein